MRKTNLFEKIVFIVAITVGISGLYMIHNARSTESWLGIIAIFSWLTLIFIMILAATNEDMKEELAVIIKEHITETKVLKELNHDMLSELKLMREDLKNKK